MAAMLGIAARWRAASAAARTRTALCWLAVRRARRIGSVWSGVIGWFLLAADVGEQRRGRLADDAQELHGNGGIELGPAAACHADGFVDVGSLAGGQAADQLLAAVDEPADRPHRLRRGEGLAAGPRFHIGRRGPDAARGGP